MQRRGRVELAACHWHAGQRSSWDPLEWAGGSDVGLDRIAAPWSATNSCRGQTSRPCGPNRSAPETPGDPSSSAGSEERACCGGFEG